MDLCGLGELLSQPECWDRRHSHLAPELVRGLADEAPISAEDMFRL